MQKLKDLLGGSKEDMRNRSGSNTSAESFVTGASCGVKGWITSKAFSIVFFIKFKFWSTFVWFFNTSLISEFSHLKPRPFLWMISLPKWYQESSAEIFYEIPQGNLYVYYGLWWLWHYDARNVYCSPSIALRTFGQRYQNEQFSSNYPVSLVGFQKFFLF